MVNVGQIEDYLNDKSGAEGDIVEITGEGLIEEKTEDNGRTKKILNIPVLLNGQSKLTYTPGKKALAELREHYGKETKQWIGKKFQIKFVVMQIGNKEINVIKPVPLKQ